MNPRTLFYATVALAAHSLVLPPLTTATTPLVTLSADFAHPYVTVPADFLGLSFDTPRVSDDNYLVPESTTLIQLIRNLSPNGVLRIGGGYSDVPVTSTNAITPQKAARFAAFVRATGWKVIWGLNMASTTPDRCADQASVMTNALGDSLLAFQLGNEPEFWVTLGYRSDPYGPGQYVWEWTHKYYPAVKKKCPAAQFDGPDLAYDLAWLEPFASNTKGLVKFVSHHRYSSAPGPNALNAILNAILNAHDSQVGQMNAAKVQAKGVPIRLTEFNSVYNGGQSGVSDTFAATLWGIDYALSVASEGYLGLNMHGNQEVGTYAPYSPIIRYGDGTFHAQPSYHALRFFGRFAQGSMFPVTLTGAPAGTRAYAVTGKDGAKRFVILNLSQSTAINVRIPQADNAQWRVHTLTAAKVTDATLFFDGIRVYSDGAAFYTPGTLKQMTQATVNVPPVSAVVVEIN
jgi:hypothetical protein